MRKLEELSKAIRWYESNIEEHVRAEDNHPKTLQYLLVAYNSFAEHCGLQRLDLFRDIGDAQVAFATLRRRVDEVAS